MKLLKNALLKLKANFNNYDGNKGNFQWAVKESHPKLFKLIISSFGKSFNEKVYCLLNDITETPKCKHCSVKTVLFKNINVGFKTYCSSACGYNDPDLKDARKNTMLKKYGVVHALQVKEIAQKISEQNKVLFSKDGAGRKNYESTMQKKYGVTNPMEIKDFREKISISHSMRSVGDVAETVAKTQQTKLRKYGDSTYNNTVKSKETLKIKYGVMHPNQLKCSPSWLAIKNKKQFLEETLPYLHPLKLARDYNLAFSTVYNLVNKFQLKDLVRKTFNAEYEIEQFVTSLQLKIKTNDKAILEGKEIDILIPEKNIGIEHNGIYWHSELQGKDEKYHLNKTILAEKKGIQLIHIFENEWLEKQEIVKSIISSSCDIFSKEIIVENCVIAEISTAEKNYFLEENHLQGIDSSTIHLGLLFQSELVGVMTFGNSRFDTKHQFEMYRFCIKSGVQIIGAASELLLYFKKVYTPHSIIAYVNRRFSNEKFYEKIGFTKLEETAPSCLYFGKQINGLIDMEQFQKYCLENNTTTEWENVKNNGYNRIWDCGNYVFELNF